MQLLTEIDGEPSSRKAELVMKGGLMLEMRLISDAVRTPTGDEGGLMLEMRLIADAVRIPTKAHMLTIDPIRVF